MNSTTLNTLADDLPSIRFSHAQAAGQAMYDRWVAQAEMPPPMDRDDAGWADMFRAGYEALRAKSLLSQPSTKGE